MSQLKGSQAERVNSPFLYLFVLISPPMDWIGPPIFGRATCFTQSTDANVNFTQKHPHTQNYYYSPRIMFNQTSGHPMMHLH